jgi:hypothetical protein
VLEKADEEGTINEGGRWRKKKLKRGLSKEAVTRDMIDEVGGFHFSPFRASDCASWRLLHE